jgi:hypothetical protein
MRAGEAAKAVEKTRFKSEKWKMKNEKSAGRNAYWRKSPARLPSARSGPPAQKPSLFWKFDEGTVNNGIRGRDGFVRDSISTSSGD